MIAVPVLQKITKGAKTIRSITSFNNKLFVIVDNNIYSFTPESDGKVKEEPLKFEGSSDEITSFVISETQKTLTAGTRSGNILRWDLNNPYIALQLPKQNNAVYMLKALKIASIDHMIFGNKQSGVLAMTLNNDLINMQVVYRCNEKIRWVNGSDDYIFGATADLSAVNIWHSDEFDHVMWRIVPGGRIQDIELWIENT